jgi:hypothetical protein
MKLLKKMKEKKSETNKLTCFLIFKNLFLILIHQNNPKILKIINLNQKNNFFDRKVDFNVTPNGV